MMGSLFRRSRLSRKAISSNRLALAAALLCTATTASAEEKIVKTEKASFRTVVMAKDLKAPWGLVKLPDGRFLVTERPGSIRVIENDKVAGEPLAGVPKVWANGQGGLLDIELHPDYKANGWIYIAYSDEWNGKATTRVVRCKLKGNALTDFQDIFKAADDQYVNGGNHFGCRIEFDGKGYIFFTIGERGDQKKAQLLDRVQGKVHRLHDDGRVPQDNPFVKTANAQPSIWTYGNRNPQGLRFQPGTGKLWETEHGPRGGDELNVIRKGANYGWPVITYGINYNGTPITDITEKEGMEQPVTYWVPSIAACGLDFYSGGKFPGWKGNAFVAALAHSKLQRVELDGEKAVHQEEILKGTGRMRDVRCFDDGYVYIVYDSPGQVVRLEPAE